MGTTMISVRPGDKIGFVEERNSYTVQAVSSDGRWAVCTKEFAACDTVIYTVVDFENQVRGRDDCHGLGYETREQCERARDMFDSGEAEHSHRYPPIALNINRWRRP
jgi:hypothetical protein